MVLLRTLAHLFLVLALLAGGVAPASASAPMDDGMDTAMAMSPPCHDLAGEPAAQPSNDPAAMPDCCDDGACACDCLQHATADFVVAPPPPRPMLRGLDAAPRVGVLPRTRAAPDIRPPIA